MSEKLPIHDRQSGHSNHPGRRSVARAVASAIDKLVVWRKDGEINLVGGYHPSEALPFAGQPRTVKNIFVEYGQTDTELDIYTHPDWENPGGSFLPPQNQPTTSTLSEKHSNWENEGGSPGPLKNSVYDSRAGENKGAGISPYSLSDEVGLIVERNRKRELWKEVGPSE